MAVRLARPANRSDPATDDGNDPAAQARVDAIKLMTLDILQWVEPTATVEEVRAAAAAFLSAEARDNLQRAADACDDRQQPDWDWRGWLREALEQPASIKHPSIPDPGEERQAHERRVEMFRAVQRDAEALRKTLLAALPLVDKAWIAHYQGAASELALVARFAGIKVAIGQGLRFVSSGGHKPREPYFDLFLEVVEHRKATRRQVVELALDVLEGQSGEAAKAILFPDDKWNQFTNRRDRYADLLARFDAAATYRRRQWKKTFAMVQKELAARQAEGWEAPPARRGRAKSR